MHLKGTKSPRLPQTLWFKSAALCEHLFEQEPSIHADLALSLLRMSAIRSALPWFWSGAIRFCVGRFPRLLHRSREDEKWVFRAALGGCSLFLVLFKTACAGWNCKMVRNGEHWLEYRQQHLLVLKAPDCLDVIAFPKQRKWCWWIPRQRTVHQGGKWLCV